MADPHFLIRPEFKRTIAHDGSFTSAGLIIEILTAGEAAPEEIVQAARDLFGAVKTVVYAELKLPYEEDAETGVLYEAFPEARPAAPKRAPKAVAAPAAPAAAAGSAPVRRRNLQAAVKPPMTRDDYWQDLVANPSGWVCNIEAKEDGTAPANVPDYKSVVYKDSAGRFVGLYLYDQQGNWQCPFDELPDSGFATFPS